MDEQHYWYRYFKRRGLKYSGIPSIKKMSELVWNEFNDKEYPGMSKAEAKIYLNKMKSIRVNKKESVKEVYCKPCAYFVGSRDYLWVKIGSTNNLYDRLINLQNGCPFDLEILSYIPSNNHVKTEKKLHKKFQHVRVRGEWFSLTDEIEQFIDEVNSSR